MTRHFLFLQGIASPFFASLGKRLRRRGHLVTKVNFCGGDVLFWPWPGTLAFRGRSEYWGPWLERLIAGRQVTDVVLFGDCRPNHVSALTIAAAAGVRVHVFEEGYVRPSYITVEQGGVNARSALPLDPVWLRDEAKVLPDVSPVDYGGALNLRVAFDIAYNVVSTVLMPLFPHYRSHRPYWIWREYASWLGRLAGLPREGRRARAAVSALHSSGVRYALFPLQLDTDAQIRHHSPFKRLIPAIDHVLNSFAAHAPATMRLVIKNHPLDNGMIPYGRLIAERSAALGVADRVVYIDGGDLNGLIRRSSGVVTVNSTVGMTALTLGVPVRLLAPAIYDVAGIVDTQPLDGFWSNAVAPDSGLLADFIKVLVHHTQVNGNFYSRDGIAAATSGCLERLGGTA